MSYTGLPQQPSTSTTPSKTATSIKGGTTPSTETEIRTSPEEKGTGQQIERSYPAGPKERVRCQKTGKIL